MGYVPYEKPGGKTKGIFPANQSVGAATIWLFQTRPNDIRKNIYILEF
jgi:hypothetical protein